MHCEARRDVFRIADADDFMLLVVGERTCDMAKLPGEILMNKKKSHC